MNKDPIQTYQLDIKSLFERGNMATKKNLPVIIRCMFIILFIILVSFVLFFNIYNIESVPQLESMQTETYFFNMIVTVVLAPLWAGIAMLAVKTERQQEIRVGVVFNYVPLLLALATAELCISLLTQVGMTLFVIPAIYIFIATSFTKLLIADKQISPFKAIQYSIQMANRYLLQLVVLFAIFFALALLGVLTFGLAFIWIAPLYYNVTGILYNDLFGGYNDGDADDEAQPVNLNKQTEETRFDA